MTTYKQLLTQRELRNGISTGIDAEYITCHYLMARKDFKWALRWDDLRFPGDYRWQQIERGIDVVAEHIDGSIWAIQVKDYDKFVDYNAFTKMNAFVQSGARRGVKFDRMALVCTNKPAGRVLIEVCEENNTVIFDRTDLAKFKWPTINTIKRDYKRMVRTADPKLVRRRLAVPRNQPKPLWTHQKQCLKALRKHFKTGTRARVYMVTGAGKTITFVKLAEDYDNVLVVVPRLLLAQQTYEKFMQQTKRPYDHILFVASENVSRRYDDLKASDLTGTHTTDPDEIAAFMELPGRKLIISTYKSSERIREAEVDIDLAIFDEAHHAAGFTYNGDNPKLAQALLHYRGIERRLFLTATPRVYTSDIKQAAAEGGHYVASLDNALTFGRLAYEFSYENALNAPEPIVKPYEIHLVVLRDEEYRDALRGKLVKDIATKRNIASPHIVAALAQAKVVKTHKLHHGIGFANKIDNANMMRDYYMRFVGNHFAETLSSLRSIDDNKRALTKFEEASEGFITNVNILSEGMDSPCIDYIVFADPMQSKQAIAQKIGRGLRYDPAKPDAKLIVVVPIILEADDTVGAGKFNPILEVLGAMSTMDKTLEVELNEIARNLPSTGSERRFKIDADIPDIDITRLRKMIATTVFSHAPMDWWARFAELEAYIAEHNCLPTQREKELGTWVFTQQRRYNGTSPNARPLSSEEIEALESLPFWSWKSRSGKWWNRFSELEAYIAEHGRLPQRGNSLDRWTHTQRMRYNGTAHYGPIPPDQIEALESLGDIWKWVTRLPINTPEWWQEFIYRNDDTTPKTRRGAQSRYNYAIRARFLYRDGKMSKAEQQRCRKNYPNIWKWLNQ